MNKKYIAFAAVAVIAVTGILVINKNTKKPVLNDAQNIPFGTIFTDHMFVMEWDEKQGWHKERIEPYHPLSFSPSSVHIHYGQEIFEGMKAFYTNTGRIALYRPLDHLERMNRSAEIMSMPSIDTKKVLSWLKKLIAKDSDWVPQQKGTALYIRPTMIATENTINLKPSSSYIFFIILSPAGHFYKEGFNPIKVLVSQTYTRASAGGVGQAKTGGNYAASMRAQVEAKKSGHAQVLWLDPVERKYVDEVGSMNIFFVTPREIITPSLNGTILPGITRRSLLQLGQEAAGLPIVERRISIQEVIEGIKNGMITEVFGSGTAAVITPVGALTYNNETVSINGNKTGPVTQKIYNTLTGIQYGSLPDTHHWLEFVDVQEK